MHDLGIDMPIVMPATNIIGADSMVHKIIESGMVATSMSNIYENWNREGAVGKLSYR